MKFPIKKYALSVMIVTCVLSLFIGPPVLAGTIDTPLAESIVSADPNETFPVIIRLVKNTDRRALRNKRMAPGKLAERLKNNSAASRGLLKARLKSKGVKGVASLWMINGLSARLTHEQILELANDPNVESIVLDEVIVAPVAPKSKPKGKSNGKLKVDPQVDPQALAGAGWDNLGAVNAPTMWQNGVDGSGVVVAVMDSGVDYNHPDLAANWRGGTNSWYDPHGQHTTPYDATGHGTQVMGIIAGGSAGGSPIGMAPGAQWIAVKIYDDSGRATYGDIHLGFQWLLDPDGQPDTTDAPHVVNNSWGLGNLLNQCVTEFQEDIQALKNAGIAVVFSGGNYGPSDASNVSPANYPESFAVGAVDENLAATTFSSRGPSVCDGGFFPDVSAPGVDIYTADRTFGGVFPDSYTLATGSSFAAPHAAGAMALLRGAYPGATLGELESALIDSGVDMGELGPDDVYGFGVINVAGADDLLQSSGCVDGDGDGYFSSTECGTVVDCDDTNAAIHPSAAEIKHDGIDQDCNGYDLTINITKAVYRANKDILRVKATSTLGADADLTLAGYGAMRWRPKRQHWFIRIRRVGGDPEVVTVSGVEGSEERPTKVRGRPRRQKGN